MEFSESFPNSDESEDRIRSSTLNPMVEIEDQALQAAMPQAAAFEPATIEQMKVTIERCRRWYGQQAPAWWLRLCEAASFCRCTSLSEPGEIQSVHLKRESADMRERGLSANVNPIVDGDQQENSSSSSSGTTRSGVACWSPAGLWYIISRLLMIVVLLVVVFMASAGTYGTTMTYAMILPGIFGTCSAIAASLFSVLQKKFDQALDDAANLASSSRKYPFALEPNDVAGAAHSSFIFVAFWTVFGLVVSIVYAGTTRNATPVTIFLQATGAVFYIPCFGAVLFILYLDIKRARKHIVPLADGARDQSLTAEEYRRARDSIRLIFEEWQSLFWLLAVAAVYNTCGMIIFMALNDDLSTTDDAVYKASSLPNFRTYTIISDLWTIGCMGKEFALLFYLTWYVGRVNDVADDVITDVFLWEDPSADEEHGDEGSDEGEATEIELLKRKIGEMEASNRGRDKELRRVSIIVEGSNPDFFTPIDPKFRRTVFHRLISTKAGGISIRVMGIRWTTRRVQALAGSFSLSMASVLWYRYRSSAELS